MKKYNVYKQVISKYCEYLVFIGCRKADNKNDACMQFRNGEYQDCFLTAKVII